MGRIFKRVDDPTNRLSRSTKIVPPLLSFIFFVTHVSDLHAHLLKHVDVIDKRQCSSVLNGSFLGSAFKLDDSC
jgi:hypothetical protein